MQGGLAERAHSNETAGASSLMRPPFIFLLYYIYMGLVSRLQTIGEEDKLEAVKKLVERATPDFDFFFMITLAVLMSSFGLLLGSETVVIGSMLIAPILYPMLGLSLGVSMSDPVLMRRSFVTILKASGIAVVASAASALVYGTTYTGPLAQTTEILSRATPSLLFLAVAIVSGLAVTYAMVKPKLSETLPGIAISVALLPPLSVIGIGIVWFSAPLTIGALSLFLVNMLGIVAASSVSFSLMNVHGERKVAQTTIQKEERRVEREAIKVKEADAAVSEGRPIPPTTPHA